jgi:hypothetical protein
MSKSKYLYSLQCTCAQPYKQTEQQIVKDAEGHVVRSTCNLHGNMVIFPRYMYICPNYNENSSLSFSLSFILFEQLVYFLFMTLKRCFSHCVFWFLLAIIFAWLVFGQIWSSSVRLLGNLLVHVGFGHVLSLLVYAKYV